MKDQKKVLIVEDEEMLRAVLSFHIFEIGYYAIEATDGLDALEKFDQNEIDIIVTDLRMPKMDGYQLIQKIMEIRNIPIIVLTGFAEPPPWILRHEGAVKVLQKPVEMDSLINCIRNPYQCYDQKPELSKKIELTASLHEDQNAHYIKVGRHGFYLCGEFSEFTRNEHIYFKIEITGHKNPLQGWGCIIFINDKDHEPNLRFRGLMIEIKELETSQGDFEKLIPENESFRSIPLLSSINFKGTKDAV